MPDSMPFNRRPVAPLSDISDVYVDETSQTKHRYLALGALVIAKSRVQAFEDALQAARLPELPSGELKWNKVSRSKLPAYKRFIDVFFTFGGVSHRIEFHSLYVDTTLIRDKAFNAGSREVGFNKEIFQIVKKCAVVHPNRLIHVYLDNRTTTSTTSHLRDMLNFRLRKESDKRDWPFRRIHYLDSHKSACLQIVDVLLGSVAFQLNGHAVAETASPAKIELSEYIKRRAPYFSALVGTRRLGKFTIWQRELQKVRRPVTLGG